MSTRRYKPFSRRPLLAGALLCWAGASQAAVGYCVKNVGLTAEGTLPGPASTALSADKILTGKPKKSAASGSSGVLRMLIPSALRHNPSS